MGGWEWEAPRSRVLVCGGGGGWSGVVTGGALAAMRCEAHGAPAHIAIPDARLHCGLPSHPNTAPAIQLQRPQQAPTTAAPLRRQSRSWRPPPRHPRPQRGRRGRRRQLLRRRAFWPAAAPAARLRARARRPRQARRRRGRRRVGRVGSCRCRTGGSRHGWPRWSRWVGAWGGGQGPRRGLVAKAWLGGEGMGWWQQISIQSGARGRTESWWGQVGRACSLSPATLHRTAQLG